MVRRRYSSSSQMILLGSLVFGTLLASCTNSRLVPSTSGSGQDQQNAGGDSDPVATYKITQVTLAKQTSGNTSSTFSVFFDATSIPAPITNSCGIPSSNSIASKPCLCQFSWQQVNPFSPTSSPVSRLVLTPVTSVQPNLVVCAAPEIFSDDKELPVGTELKIKVIPGPGSSATIATTEYKYRKTAGTVADGSFQDEQGRFFDDILRYTCFEQFKRGMSITNKKAPATGGQEGSQQVMVPLASQFCVAKDGETGGAEGCESMPPAENSAQAYYYNLYTRESEIGGINYSNQRYTCPKVKEPLISGMGPGHHWPLDSSFALSLGPTPEFPVGVEAFTKLANGAGDPGSQGSVCYPAQANSNDPDAGEVQVGDNASLVKACLGFAAKPNSDGTCPYFKDSNGKVRQTFRLRRFIALYPQLFDSRGYPVNQAQAVDTIYVLDRPVFFAGANENKPYTMRGPKPCPFAFFDHKGVLGVEDGLYKGGVRPVYAATNHSDWKGKNVDGIQLPNTDSANSCGAALPLLNDDMTLLSIATVHAQNPKYKSLYMRPIRPWAPHYVEDTDFLACAPQSNEMRDPPLHFSKDPTTGNVAWCAEAYPTQNDNVQFLDQRPDSNSNFHGNVQPFTSHVVKHTASTDCEHKPSNINKPVGKYPADGAAWHPNTLIVDRRTGLGGGVENVPATKTCDRTVSNISITWPKFPLLAPPEHVELALSKDTTYGCVITYDNGGGKTGTKSPAEGCCGLNVSVWTGVPADGETDQKLVNRSAHLEPDQRCLIPKY